MAGVSMLDRRKFQFGLRSVLVSILLVGAWLGLFRFEVFRHRLAWMGLAVLRSFRQRRGNRLPTQPKRPMNEFVADPHWGWWIVWYFYLGGIAAGA